MYLKSIDVKGINAIFYNYELCKNNEGRSLMCGNNDNIRNKLQTTLTKVVNKGSNNMIAIVI
mgnify:CR=1 FL=1